MSSPNEQNFLLKKYWSDPVWSKVISWAIITSAVGLATFIFDGWPGIWNFGKEAYDFALSRTLLPNWLIATLGLFAVISTCFLGIIIWQETASPGSSAEKWRSYRSDEFLELRWRWSFLDNGEPYQLTTFCPKCDFQLFGKSENLFLSGLSGATYSVTFSCDHCGNKRFGVFEGSYDDMERYVKRCIQLKLRNGTWDQSTISEKATVESGQDSKSA